MNEYSSKKIKGRHIKYTLFSTSTLFMTRHNTVTPGTYRLEKLPLKHVGKKLKKSLPSQNLIK
jgi:hypothetical protein